MINHLSNQLDETTGNNLMDITFVVEHDNLDVAQKENLHKVPLTIDWPLESEKSLKDL